MMNLNTQILPTHFLDSLGWAIVHSLWQCIIALSLVLLFRALAPNKTPASQYLVQITCLGLCLISFVATFFIYYSAPIASITTLFDAGTQQYFTITSTASTGQTASLLENQYTIQLNNITPLFGIFWCVGFLLMTTRYFGAFYLTQQLKVKGTNNVSKVWMNRFLELAENTGVTNKAKLMISRHVDGPLTIGFFKPVVLVPVSFLTSLPQDQVEAILLHELAHIRRFDYLLNLIQISIKTIMFYHPAIHILSRYIDENREQACDDIAVSQTRNPKPLILGLASLRLQTNNELAMAANDQESPLMFRLKRLVGPIEKQKRPEHIVFSILTTVLIGSLIVGSSSIAESLQSQQNSHEIKHSTIHNQDYHFETMTIDKQNITVKKVADGSRWVLMDNSWYNIDTNPDIINQLPSLPRAPQTPKPDWCESCELAGKHNYIDMEAFESKMEQFQVNMEYYAADMSRYAQEVANKKPRREEINRWENNFNENFNTNLKQNSKTYKNHDSKTNLNYISYHIETDKKNTYQLETEIQNEIVKMMLADGIISWNDDLTVISNLGQKITMNGEPIPGHLCNKYNSLMDDLEIKGELILQIPRERTYNKVSKK